MFEAVRDLLYKLTAPWSQRRVGPHARFLSRFGHVFALLVSSTGHGFGEEDLLTWNVNQNIVSVGSGVATAVVAGISGGELRGGGTQGNEGSPAGTWNRTFSPATASFAEAKDAGHCFWVATAVEPGYTSRISGITALNLTRTSSPPLTLA